MAEKNQTKIFWQGPEYLYREKGSDWYWAVGIISLAFVVASILIENYIFAVFIALASFTLMMFASKRPRIVDIKITEEGILFEKYFYHFDSIESFWIDPELGRIIVKTKKTLMPLLVLPLEDNHPDTIREELLNYIDEEEINESVFQRTLEFLGF